MNFKPDRFTFLPHDWTDDVLTTVFDRFVRHDGRLPVLCRDGLKLPVGSVSNADALRAFAEECSILCSVRSLKRSSRLMRSAATKSHQSIQASIAQ